MSDGEDSSIWEKAAAWVAKLFWARAGKAMAKAILYGPDGKLKWRNLVYLLGWFGGAAFCWFAPLFMQGGHWHTGSHFLDTFHESLYWAPYLLLARLFAVAAFIAVTMFIAAMWLALGESLLANNEMMGLEVLRFVKDIGLHEGNLSETEEEKARAQEAVAKKIASSKKRVRVMVINGYKDLVPAESVIRRALEQKQSALKFHLLLLDPYSSYARDRADALREEYTHEASRKRYIRDCHRTIEVLAQLKRKGAHIEHRLYCSRPFFRIWLFDKELFVQAYEGGKHGHDTALYNFTKKGRSMYGVADHMFCYYWDRGFVHTDESLRKMGPAFTMYLAQMYGVEIGTPFDVDATRTRILDHAKRELEAALKAEEERKLNDD